MEFNAAQYCHYNTWAMKELCKHLKTLPPDIIHQSIQSVFPTVYDTLVHIYVVDSGWLEVMTNPDYQLTKEGVDALVAETAGKSLEALEHILRSFYGRLENFAATHDMAQKVIFFGLEMQYGDILLHVMNHGTYHRGNITAMLRQMGYAGTRTDYAFYLYSLAQA
jgi:uncharacterized damage-inducible protein DinB